MLVIFALASVIFSIFAIPFPAGASYFTTLAGIVSLIIFCRIYKGEFLGPVKGGNVQVALRLASVMLLYYAFIMLQTTFVGEWQAPKAAFFGTAITAGVVEETLFRGFLMSYLIKFKKEEKDLPLILAICSIAFGLMHASNLFLGGAFGITIIQVICTFGLGAIFGAIYMRSGNIIVTMFAHGITDFVALLDLTQTGDNGTMIAQVQWNNILDMVICIGLFVFAFYLIRPAKRAEIKELWDRKWCRA